jgi:hypothetical protein
VEPSTALALLLAAVVEILHGQVLHDSWSTAASSSSRENLSKRKHTASSQSFPHELDAVAHPGDQNLRRPHQV